MIGNYVGIAKNKLIKITLVSIDTPQFDIFFAPFFPSWPPSIMSSERQIAQMCKFILQEAKEKANEIRIKTEHDFHKDKQLRVIAANEKTDEAFEQQKKRLESDKKVSFFVHTLVCNPFETVFCA